MRVPLPLNSYLAFFLKVNSSITIFVNNVILEFLQWLSKQFMPTVPMEEYLPQYTYPACSSFLFFFFFLTVIIYDNEGWTLKSIEDLYSTSK